MTELFNFRSGFNYEVLNYPIGDGACVAIDTRQCVDTSTRNNASQEKADVLLQEETPSDYRGKLQTIVDTG